MENGEQFNRLITRFSQHFFFIAPRPHKAGDVDDEKKKQKSAFHNDTNTTCPQSLIGLFFTCR